MPTDQRKACAKCKIEFITEPEDFDFYAKIDVPPPTLCPDCRQRRRYVWRNERTLYRRNCDLCGKSTVTIYSPNKPFKVYCPPCWWSDKWDPFAFGKDFDFSRPFFDQFRELQLQVPRIALLTKNSTNSEYTNHASNNKNCYLCFSIFNSEDVYYSTNVWKKAKDCFDCYHLDDGTELLYECVDAFQCYRCQFGLQIRSCTDCLYCYDCRGSSNCFLSHNLRNKQYQILNQQYSKEEYFKKLEEYRLDTFSGRQRVLQEFTAMIGEASIHRFAQIEKSENALGNMIFNSRNVKYAFDADRTEDSKYVIISPDVKTSMDAYHFGLKGELIYESHGLVNAYCVLFSHLSYDDSYITYCDGCHNSQNLFGCVGMKQGSYSILNKKYSEEEYSTLKEKIVFHMKATKEYGEFFPPRLSPFGYNETQAQVYMPLSQNEALATGFQWEEKTPGTFGKETIPPEKIPDAIQDVQDSILKEVLKCMACGKNYNIVQPELDFYRREKVPIPRECPDCRYKRRIASRPPRKLWHRQCLCNSPTITAHGKNTTAHFHGDAACPNEFETSFAPERPEIIYCEQCYNSEIA